MRSRTPVRRCVVLVALTLSAACSQGRSSLSRPADAEDPWAKRAWIQKAGRALLLGSTLTDGEVEALAAKSRQDAVETLMADPRFADTVLDFNLFFLGFKPATLFAADPKDPTARVYDPAVSQKPQALAAAQALLAGRDYLTLFDLAQPPYLLPLGAPIPYDPDTQKPIDPAPPAAQLRTRFFTKVLADHDALTALFVLANGAEPAAAAKAACGAVNDKVNAVFTGLFLTGLSIPQTTDVFFAAYLDLFVACGSPDVHTMDKVHASLTTARTNLTTLAANAPAYASDTYKVRSLGDIRAVDPALVGVPNAEKTGYTTGGFWTPLPNASTNFNRKRAAYVLRTYFCDDLTPIKIAQPDAHAGNRHASDPGCQACHYKLDPMAGFFRYRGINGLNYEGSPYLTFDDQAVVSGAKLTAYWDSWRAPAGAGRDWNVGFIRTPSLADDAKNTYGSSLEDLAGILRTAPEVKQCLVKRLASYVLGDGQTYDGGWLRTLTAKFDEPAAAGGPAASSAAFREVLATLVQSNAFSVQDPAPDQCYDYAPGAPPSSLPCAVSFVVNNNCATCHNSAGASGGLDLTSWVAAPDGSTGFAHVDEHGQRLGKAASLARILDRISTADAERQMPKSRYMSPGDRAKLYQWLNQELTTGSGGH